MRSSAARSGRAGRAGAVCGIAGPSAGARTRARSRQGEAGLRAPSPFPRVPGRAGRCPQHRPRCRYRCCRGAGPRPWRRGGRPDPRGARRLIGPELLGDPLDHDYTALVMPFLQQAQQVRGLGDGVGAEHLERAYDGAVVVSGVAVSLERADRAPVGGVFVTGQGESESVDERGAPAAAAEVVARC